jgi:hypothetical protein
MPLVIDAAGADLRPPSRDQRDFPRGHSPHTIPTTQGSCGTLVNRTTAPYLRRSSMLLADRGNKSGCSALEVWLATIVFE